MRGIITMGNAKKCCLCGGIYSGYGHNPQPFAEGRCCAICNFEKVIPERVRLFGAIRR